MASKIFSLLPFICLLLTLLSHKVLADSNGQKPLSSGFLKSLQGYKKGDKVKGIQYLKKYLQYFGYLNPSQVSSNVDNNDLFDENIESAIKTYQINFNLKPTGILDPETVSKMEMPRCGVPDIINGTTRMCSGYKMHHHGSNNSFHTQYAFLPGTPKWPPSTQLLNYAFQPGTREDVNEPVRQAFLKWSEVLTTIMYGFGGDYDSADIKISFQTGDHEDGFPFDGPFKILAHAFSPPDGRFHFDASETWSAGAAKGAHDMGTVALHEIGHLLGLAHSSVEAAIMYPLIPYEQSKDMNDDDIQGIKALYGN